MRIEAGTNLVGGQPVSMNNMREVSRICREHGMPLIYNASLLSDSLFFIKTREYGYKNADIKDITREIASFMDIIYFSARKLILLTYPYGQYRAGALAAAFYLASGVRGMERGTLSEQRNSDGSERLDEMELLRLAVPKRVFTLSQLRSCSHR